jgi:hypothetical protein
MRFSVPAPLGFQAAFHKVGRADLFFDAHADEDTSYTFAYWNWGVASFSPATRNFLVRVRKAVDGLLWGHVQLRQTDRQSVFLSVLRDKSPEGELLNSDVAPSLRLAFPFCRGLGAKHARALAENLKPRPHTFKVQGRLGAMPTPSVHHMDLFFPIVGLCLRLVVRVSELCGSAGCV